MRNKLNCSNPFTSYDTQVSSKNLLCQAGSTQSLKGNRLQCLLDQEEKPFPDLPAEHSLPCSAGLTCLNQGSVDLCFWKRAQKPPGHICLVFSWDNQTITSCKICLEFQILGQGATLLKCVLPDTVFLGGLQWLPSKPLTHTLPSLILLHKKVHFWHH